MSLKATLDYNGIKYGIGDGNFLIYDHQGHELTRYYIRDIGFSLGENSGNGDVHELTINLPNGVTLTYKDTYKLAYFANALIIEKEKLLNK